MKRIFYDALRVKDFTQLQGGNDKVYIEIVQLLCFAFDSSLPLVIDKSKLDYLKGIDTAYKYVKDLKFGPFSVLIRALEDNDMIIIAVDETDKE